MPYPISKLAYGLRCRLHDLATPAERYKLQIAAGNPAICPPIQTKQTSETNVSIKYEEGVINAHPLFIEKNSPVYTTDKLCLINIGLEHLTCEPTSHFIYDETIVLLNCNLSKNFIKKVSNLADNVSNITHIDLSETTNADYVFKMSDILTVFPNLCDISIDNVPFDDTWMSEILQYPEHSITDIQLIMTLEQFTALPIDDLVAFLQAQKQGLHLSLGIEPTAELVPLQLDLAEFPHFQFKTWGFDFEYECGFNENLRQYEQNTRLQVCFSINSTERVVATVTVRIEGTGLTSTFTRTVDPYFGVGHFVSHASLAQLFERGSVTIRFNVDFHIHARWHTLAVSQPSHDIEPDLTIIARNGQQEEEFRVHKQAFKLASDVITAAFNHDTVENQTNTIVIEGFEINVVKTSIDFIYGREVHNPSMELIIGVLRFVDSRNFCRIPNWTSLYRG
uniref:BTB domain-containing protein n=1 Tax=Panagrellus redivivus TaxID=6233 RepID=A0A7E4WBS5_PANRE